ncbi:uncharacterized protein LOC111341665 [Stylophora pistillata]|uniref:uncharacterized protein LOC111341665 n=1 Tax=Stylophora pistillata TaxID=50429 RepID=UPI000C03F00B|nr:uncharacterized protein LOC111341665 [Stylophora pistillata]
MITIIRKPHSSRAEEDDVVHPTDSLYSIRRALASLDGCVPNESGEEGEYNGVPQEKEDSEDGVPPEKEDSGDSVTEVVNEDESGSGKGELRNLSKENLRAVQKGKKCEWES